MIKELFFFFCIVHIFCNFYLQSLKITERKRENIILVLMHILVYAISALLLLKIALPGMPWGCYVIFVTAHAIIDLSKYGICNNRIIKQKNINLRDSIIFFSDQILHIIVLVIIIYGIKDIDINTLYNKEIVGFFKEINISLSLLIRWMLKLIIICKPTNVLISTILKKYRPEEDCVATDKNAGRFIGTLERIIITILISINQYSAVGLVLTAKSIARYDKISKNQEFAEYYLLGTLLSTICSIVIAVLI